MKHRWVVGVVSILLSIAVFIHHYLIHGYFCDWRDVNNHETMALSLLWFGLGPLPTYEYYRLKLINRKSYREV